MRWNVYFLERRTRNLIGLGCVNAPHAPGAIRRAEKKWPKYCDHTRAQFGFHVIPYKKDSRSLGKQGK